MLNKLCQLAARNFPFSLILENSNRKVAVEKISLALEYFWLEEARHFNREQIQEVIFDEHPNSWDMVIKTYLIHQKGELDKSMRRSLLFLLLREKLRKEDILDIYNLTGIEFQVQYLLALEELANDCQVELIHNLSVCHKTKKLIGDTLMTYYPSAPGLKENHSHTCPSCQETISKLSIKLDYLKGKLPGKLEFLTEREKSHLEKTLRKAIYLTQPQKKKINIFSNFLR